MRFFFILFFIFHFSYSDDFQLINTEQQLNHFLQSTTLNVLVFVDDEICKDETKPECRQQREQLKQIQELSTSEHAQFAISTNKNLADKNFNIHGSFPKLCFFRNGFPIIYHDSISNLDTLSEWFAETRALVTKVLTDKTFEHDTQASTGATTGDWFIIFKKSNESRRIIPAWEAASLQFRNRAIFAYVNIDENPNLQKRFHLYNLPAFILFKRGKMYRYEGTSWQQTAFVEFIENNYQKTKAETVPPELSAFSFSFDSAKKIIPMYFIVIPMICLAVVLVLLVFISGIRKKKRTTAERTPFQVKID